MEDITKVKEEIRGDRKVVVFVDDMADSPAQDWDMATAFYAGQHWDNTKDDLGGGVRSAGDALRHLMDQYTSVDQVVEAIKAGKFGDLYINADGNVVSHGEIIMGVDDIECPSDLYDWMYGNEVVDFITGCCDIVVKLHDFESYNECISCVCATTKKRYESICGTAGDSWKEDAKNQMESDTKIMDKWFRGEVYGFKEYALVKKHVTCEWPEWAKNCDGYAEEEDVEEWEETDSLWCIYDEPDEVIENVFNGNY